MKKTFSWHCYAVLILTLIGISHYAQAIQQTESDLNVYSKQFEEALLDKSIPDSQLLIIEAQTLKALQHRNSALRELGGNTKAFGFGPSGVRSLHQELKVMWLRIQAQPMHLAAGWRRLKADLQLSPMPLMAAIMQILLCIAAFIYWLRHAVPVIQEWSKGKGLDRDKRLSSLWQSSSWWYVRLRRPLEAWLLLSFILGVLAQLFGFINFKPIQVVINWLLWGALAILFIDGVGAARHRRWQRKDAQAKLRLRSVKWLGRIFIVTGLLLNLMYALGASGGTLAAWVSTLFLWAILPVLVVIIRWWRSPVMDKLDTPEHQEKPLPQWVLKRQKGIISLLAVLLGGGYLVVMGCLRWALSLAAEREVVRSAMAYLFRIEVARQSALDQQRNQLTPLETDNIEAFQGRYTGQWLQGIADEEIQLLTDSCLQQRSTINVIYAGRGRGKSAFIARLHEGLAAQNCTCVHVPCPAEGGFAGLLDALGESLSQLPQMGDINGVRDVTTALKETDTMVITLDDIQRLIQPTIGGLKEFERLVRFIRRTSTQLSWVFSIEAASWRFVERARGERFLFDVELELPRWKEESIAELIEQRCLDAQLDVSYDGMVLPRQIDMQDETEEESASRGYARILWEYAKGNPGVALYLWSQSLFKDEQGKTVVRLFDVPSLAGLESMSVTLLLVLRAILQLELAHKDEVAQATNLSSDEVVDALRLLMSKRYVERAERNLYTISWPWYRAITTVLNRQHLLIL